MVSGRGANGKGSLMKQANLSALVVGGSIFVAGVVLGIVVGAVSGVLLAPRSGEDTREHLRKQANELGETIKDKSQEIIAAGKRQVNSALRSKREAA